MRICLTIICKIHTILPTSNHALRNLRFYLFMIIFKPRAPLKLLLLLFLICLLPLIPFIILSFLNVTLLGLKSLLPLWHGWNLTSRIALFMSLLITAIHLLINFSMAYLKGLFSVLFSSSHKLLHSALLCSIVCTASILVRWYSALLVFLCTWLFFQFYRITRKVVSFSCILNALVWLGEERSLDVVYYDAAWFTRHIGLPAIGYKQRKAGCCHRGLHNCVFFAAYI